MVDRVERAGLQVDTRLAAFLEGQALPGSGMAANDFWSALSTLAHDFGPRNTALLEKREDLQARIDAWHKAHSNQPHDHEAYKAFLTQIGYLLPEGDDFEIETANTDPEIASVPGLSWWCRSPMPATR